MHKHTVVLLLPGKLTLQGKLNKLLVFVFVINSQHINQKLYLRRQDWANRRRKQHESELSNHNKKGPARRILLFLGPASAITHKLHSFSAKVNIFKMTMGLLDDELAVVAIEAGDSAQLLLANG